MTLLSGFENVTVLYGHIHREDTHRTGNATHFASRSLSFAFPDPAAGVPKKPVPFDPEKPFQNVGVRAIHETRGKPAIEEVSLTLREFSGTNGIQQILKGAIES